MIRRVLLLTLAAIACNVAAFGQTCPSGASWCSGTYSYDAVGNIRAIGADTYVYDTAGRLVSGTADVQRTGIMSRQDYSYDTFGNRTAASRIAGSVNCPGGCELSPAIDPLTNHITGSGAQYDAAGNLIFIQGPPDASYTYDAAGSLVHAVAGTDDRQFLYTADDERIATANGANGATWTWTVRGLDGKVLREFTSLQAPGGLPTSTRQWTKDYVWRDGLLLASVTPTTSGGTATQHFHLDHLGTPRLVTGDNGVQLSVHAYYPFGAELNLTPTEQPAELMKFTGHERDLLANDAHTLDYMHARYEMGTLGRFLTVDPVLGTASSPQSWNRYTYGLNNPLRYTDPDGRCTVDGEQHGGIWCWAHSLGLVHSGHEEAQARRSVLVAEGVVAVDSKGNEIDPSKLSDKDAYALYGDYMQDKLNAALEKMTPNPVFMGTPEKTQWGWHNSSPYRAARAQIDQPGTHETLYGKVPTQAEAVRMIEENGGKIQRIEGPHPPGSVAEVHNFSHINYTTSSGMKATVRIQGLE
jgi:RHS repeat-associated protein